MAQLKDLIVSGPSRLIGPVYGKITNAYSADTAASAPWAGITGKPTIPAAANNATITLSGHGINKSFTVNQSSNATLDLSHTHVAANITGGTNGYFLKADSAGKGVWQSVTIPTVNNGTLTIQKNGSNVGTFTANQSTNTTINITETQLSKGTTSTGTTTAKAAVADISVSNHQITLTTTPKIYSAQTSADAYHLRYNATGQTNNLHDETNLGVNYYAMITSSGGLAGGTYGFPTSNNANGLLHLWTHSKNSDSAFYGHQLGFSGNGDIYHRYAGNQAYTGPWKKLLHEGDIISPWYAAVNGGASLGDDAHADGDYSVAFGTEVQTLGGNSMAFGYNAVAEGVGSMAFGNNDTVINEYTKIADGSGSLAHGYTFGGSDTIWAEGNGSTAFGNIEYDGNPTYTSQIYAAGEGALAYGSINGWESGIEARGAGSTACGYVTEDTGHILANGNGSYAGGYTSESNIRAIGLGAHAEGYASQANEVVATGNGSHAEGHGTTALGDYSHAEGEITFANGVAVHAEGQETEARELGSHAEGGFTCAFGIYSHAEGDSSSAYGVAAHAEGAGTTASAAYTHAEGSATYAIGVASHAGGEESTTNTYAGFAHGLGVIDGPITPITAVAGCAAFGKYNQTGTTTLFSIGNGDELARSNAFHVNMDGRAYTPNGFYETSDERKKDFHGDVKVDFKDIDNIPTKYFTWKEGEDMAMKIGTSAQEIEKIYPEVVDYDKEHDAYTVDYGRLSIVALAAVKELHKENETLKSEIELLKERLDRLENK